MGGAAAKERRRLKRLQATPGPESHAETASSPPAPGGKPQPKRTPTREKDAPAKSNDAVRLRLQRKARRKASGTFKPQSESSPPAPPRPFAPKPNGKGKATPNKNARNRPFRRETAAKHGKARAKSAKKPKPKHLKRKMDQLAKSMVDGSSNVSEVEGQMKALVEQVEQYKRSKQNNVAFKEDVGARNDSTDRNGLAVGGIEGGGGQEVHTDETEDEQSGPSSGDKKPSKSSARPSFSSSDSSDEEEIADASNARPREKRRRGRRDGSPNEQLSTEKKTNSAEGDGLVVHDVKGGKEGHTDETEAEETGSSPASSASSSSSSSDSSDEEEIANVSNARTRGKRRRGRRENCSKEPDVTEKKTGADSKPAAIEENVSAKVDRDESPRPKKEDTRRCLGRKPVSDFRRGEKYPGRVRYIKPNLGAFIDIGCHSDAFCHISCVSDQFVSSVGDVLKVDDMLENVRVVEIDRRKKRVTVSLRSEEMAEREQKRLKTTRLYERGLTHDNGCSGSTAAEKSRTQSRRVGGPGSNANNCDTTPTRANDDEDRKLVERPEQHLEKEDVGIGRGGRDTASSRGKDLKRERKLARRAERRALRQAAAS